MKQFYTLFLIGLSYYMSSQSFTNGSVFNYSTGDTIVTSTTVYPDGLSFQGIISYTYRVFTSKHSSPNMDTVFYTTHDVYYTPQQCSNCTTAISAANTSFYITDLTSSVLNFTIGTRCPLQVDTSYQDECQRNVHWRYLEYNFSDTSCPVFEPNTREYTFIEGIGEFHHFRTRIIPPMENYKSVLVSAHKVGENCKVVGAVPDGIAERSASIEKLQVYPNPSNGNFSITLATEGYLTVRNILGEEVYRASAPPGISILDLTHQPAGMYMVKCQTANKIFTGSLIKH